MTYFHPALTSIRAFALLCIAMLVTGCLPSLRDGPDRLYGVEEETAAIRGALQKPDLMSNSSDYRNNYILARMYAIDLQYYAYEASLTHERQDLGFAADFINIGLTGAVPLVTAKATKDILGQTASGLTGIKNAYNDDILLNRTIQILQSQMRANRGELATTIVGKLGQPLSLYPMPLALSDLEDYYRAGTISGALLSVSSTVSTAAAIAQRDRVEAIVATTITDPNAPIVPVPRGAAPALPGDSKFTPIESNLNPGQIRKIQQLVCAKVDGKLGPHGSETRTKIFAFLKKQNPGATFTSDVLTGRERNALLDAIDAGQTNGC